MTKKLEELFNLEAEETAEEKPVEIPKHEEVRSLDDSYRAVQEITRGLPQIKELDNLDELPGGYPKEVMTREYEQQILEQVEILLRNK